MPPPQHEDDATGRVEMDPFPVSEAESSTEMGNAGKDPFPMSKAESSTKPSQVALDLVEEEEPVFDVDEPAAVPTAPQHRPVFPVQSEDNSHYLFPDVAPVAALGQPGGERLQTPIPVMELPVSIQRGFRIKMLTILLLQLLFTMGVSIALRLVSTATDEEAGVPATGLGIIFPRAGFQTLLLGIISVALLPALSTVRDRHPWNMLCTMLWSVLWATFIAAASLPGGLVKSHVLFVLFGSTTFGVFVLLVCSTFTYRDADRQGQRQLWSFWTAGWVAYALMLVAAISFGTQTGHLYEHPGHFVSAMLAATILFAWVAFDSGKLCECMQPDDYMKGVVYFYTDFLLVCCCCLFAGVVSSAS